MEDGGEFVLLLHRAQLSAAPCPFFYCKVFSWAFIRKTLIIFGANKLSRQRQIVSNAKQHNSRQTKKYLSISERKTLDRLSLSKAVFVLERDGLGLVLELIFPCSWDWPAQALNKASCLLTLYLLNKFSLQPPTTPAVTENIGKWKLWRTQNGYFRPIICNENWPYRSFKW